MVPATIAGMTETMTETRPIGWWVRRLDGLLEDVVGRVVADEELTRRHWQVLHALGSGSTAEPDLHDVLAPFGGPAEVAPVVAELVDRGWVTRIDAGRLMRTAAGAAADERIGGRISTLRRQVTDGLSAEEYRRTVAALERMARNVERALAGPPAGPDRAG